MENNDAFNSAAAPATSELAFALVDAMQGRNEGHQFAAVSLLFLLMCRRFNANPGDVLSSTGRRVEDALSIGRGEHIRAIKNYIREEL